MPTQNYIHDMQSLINELTELDNRYNKVVMGAMDKQAFAVYYAKIHGVLNHFLDPRHSREDSASVVRIAHKLLNRALRYHIDENIFTTERAVKIFNETVQLMFRITSEKIGIDQSTYENAQKTRMNLRAFNACGIAVPGYMSRYIPSQWGNDDEEKCKNADALRYAAENIIEFAKFTFNIAQNNQLVQDPFVNTSQSEGLKLVEQVSSLLTERIPVGHNEHLSNI